MRDRQEQHGMNGQGHCKPRFPLGRTVITRGVAERIPADEVYEALHRHQCGDWGQLGPEDWSVNDSALREGAGLLSAYTSTAGEAFFVITERDRSATTVLLPEEY